MIVGPCCVRLADGGSGQDCDGAVHGIVIYTGDKFTHTQFYIYIYICTKDFLVRNTVCFDCTTFNTVDAYETVEGGGEGE